MAWVQNVRGVLDKVSGEHDRRIRQAHRRNVVCGFVAGAGAVAVCFVVRWLRCGKRSNVREAWRDRAGVADLRVAAESYEPDWRACADGEIADRVVEEVVAEEAGAEGADVSEAGAPRRGDHGATRRVCRKLKMVHKTGGRDGPGSGYLGEVVADARCQGFAGVASPDNMRRARLYMTRVLKEHGVRPSHISANINKLVLAVFERTEDDIRYSKLLEEGVRCGAIVAGHDRQ